MFVGALVFASHELQAQAPPLGPEFPVNTFTPGSQLSASIASAGNGGFVVVWASNTEDGSDLGVFGQVFDRAGDKAGSEFPINTYTTNRQFVPSVAMDRNHQFVVAWSSALQDDPTGYGVFGQRFDEAGADLGSEFLINSFTPLNQTSPAVAKDGAGRFVVVWASYAEDGSDLGIFGQRFDASGAKLGAEFPVNTYTTSGQFEPSVATDEAGNFVVVWTSLTQYATFSGLFGQVFDASGQKRGPEFQINTYTDRATQAPRVASDRRGNFVVVWHQTEPGGSAQDVFARRFNASGEKVGPEFRVNTYTTAAQKFPSVTFDGLGNFAVAWTSLNQDGSQYGVFGQRFDRLGNALGPEFPINTFTTGNQLPPAVADDGTGFVVVWTSYGEDGSLSGIFGRRQSFSPVRLDVDARSGAGTFSDQNGVLEPGEIVAVDPTWGHDASDSVLDLTGTLADFGGPAGPLYLLNDGAADYGTVVKNSLTSCQDGSPGACYVVSVVGARPATHWDTTASENLSVGGGQLWKLHVGDSFTDVSRSQPFYRKIETLLHHGITSGCAATQYCPSSPVPRDQMAIFVSKALAGAGELVPTTGFVAAAAYDCAPGGVSLFSDVAASDSFCRHVHYLAAQNVTLGCASGKYCPSATITRDAMASFIAKAIVAPGGGNAVPLTYGPDPNTGRSYSCDTGSPNTHFTDVPVSNAFCKHIHFLWAKGIVDGCSATQYCPTASVSRDAMAKFLANGFGLQLYGP